MIVFRLLLIVSVYLSAAILSAWLLTRLAKSSRAKAAAAILTLLVFALIPTWDILPGRLYFNHVCETEGGLKVYRTVEGVEGFVTASSSIVRPALEKYRYSFVETKDASGKLVRYSLNDQGQLVAHDATRLRSNYVVQSSEAQRDWNIKLTEHRIVDAAGAEKLATFVQFYYPGNWLQQKFAPVLGGSKVCPVFSQDSFEKFYSEVLKPRN